MLGGRLEAHLRISIDGKDVTDKFDPYLITVTINDREHEVDTCQVELDDTDSRLMLPQDDASIEIEIGWKHTGMVTTFQGKVTDVESGFTRKQGRRVYIEGWALDTKTEIKQPQWKSWGEGEKPQGSGGGSGGSGGSSGGSSGGGGGGQISLSQVLQESAQAAGAQIQVHGDLGNLKRDFWLQAGESFQAFGRRIAREVGGHFKISNGNMASLTPINGGQSASGEAMGGIEAAWGNNLISWRIKPMLGRPQFKEAGGAWYDPHKAAHEREKAEIDGGQIYQASATHTAKEQIPTKEEAEQRAKAAAEESKKARGTGWILVNGEPSAKAGAKVTLSGARPGVDGTYNIREAEHQWHRGGGYTTRLDVDQPGGSAGSDNRYQGSGQWGGGTQGSSI